MEKRRTKFEKWLTEHQSMFGELSIAARQIVEAALKEHHIPYLNVTARQKTLKSALLKARRKGYRQPKKEMTDLAGIRVVTFTETDAAKVCVLLKTIFTVDAKRSIDKSVQLKHNKVGYRSYHFICALDEPRVKLVDFKRFASLVFEVQVRTVLQHAWAEIEHSRNYKFAGVLPTELARSLNLIAGLLEVADQQIAQLAKAIDNYQVETDQKAKRGDLNLELTSAAIVAFCRKVQKKLPTYEIATTTNHSLAVVIDECKAFGIKSVQELNQLVSRDFIAASAKYKRESTITGFLRDLLMFADLQKYFKDAHGNSWQYIDPQSVAFLTENYPRIDVKHTLQRHRVQIENPESENYYGPSDLLEDEPPDDDGPPGPPEDEPPDDDGPPEPSEDEPPVN